MNAQKIEALLPKRPLLRVGFFRTGFLNVRIRLLKRRYGAGTVVCAGRSKRKNSECNSAGGANKPDLHAGYFLAGGRLLPFAQHPIVTAADGDATRIEPFQ
jgi:hypothetical protein